MGIIFIGWRNDIINYSFTTSVQSEVADATLVWVFNVWKGTWFVLKSPRTIGRDAWSLIFIFPEIGYNNATTICIVLG